MIRLIANYSRMALSFVIGIYILRALLSQDTGLYSVYSLVTMGLATGVMLRELVRTSLVHFIANSLVSDDRDCQQNGLRCALTVSLAVALVNIFISVGLTGFTGIFDISEPYKSQFAAFMILRSLGYAAVIVIIPYMNILAYKNRMVAYNISLLGERCIDLFVVELLLYFIKNGTVDNPLVYAAYAYLVLSSLLCLGIILYTRFRCGAHLSFALTRPTAALYSTVRDNIKGSFMLVLNMAMYFRFSLVLVNILFGESVGAQYAVAIQISSYLRQSVMGLVLGLDSRFSRKNRGSMGNATIWDVNSQVNVVVVPLVFLSILAMVYIDTIVGLVTKASDLNDSLILSLTSLLLIGVAIRGSSEVWMQLMISGGKVLTFARPILYMSLLMPLVIGAISMLPNQTNILPIAQFYIVAMVMAHGFLVPRVLSMLAPQLPLKLLYRPIMGGALVVLLIFTLSRIVVSELYLIFLLIGIVLVWVYILLVTYRAQRKLKAKL